MGVFLRDKKSVKNSKRMRSEIYNRTKIPLIFISTYKNVVLVFHREIGKCLSDKFGIRRLCGIQIIEIRSARSGAHVPRKITCWVLLTFPRIFDAVI